MTRALRSVLTALLLSVVTSAAAETLYQIGNQMTWDSTPAATSAVAALAGHTLSIGHHIRNTSSLRTIVNNPTNVDVTLSTYGRFSEALPNFDWDYVSLQSFPFTTVADSTLGDDLSAANELINLAKSAGRNQETTYYVYSSWPGMSGWGNWLSWVPDELEEIENSRRFYERLVNRLRLEHGTDHIQMIPMGDVLYRLKQEIELGSVPGVSSHSQLYNGVYMNTLGDYVASTTVLATVLHQDPRGLPLPSQFSGIATETASVFQDLVWDVVNFHPYSGVAVPEPGDFDVDGDADLNDFALWRQSYGSASGSLADANNDGLINAADYILWRNNFTGSNDRIRLYQIGNSLTNNSVPEGTQATARALGYPLDVAWHIKSNSSLSVILSQPDVTNKVPTYYGPFYDALPTFEWDYITLQSFPSFVQKFTLGEDVAAANELIELAETNPLNDDTLYFVYASWPQSHVWSNWETPIPDEDDVTDVARQTYEHVVNRLRDTHGDDRIFMIPVGDVLFELKQDIDAGLVAGLSDISDVYADPRHLNELGEFIASTTVMATVLQQDPRGVAVPDVLAKPSLTEQLIAIFQDKVWDVVNFHPYSGVADPSSGQGSSASVPEPSTLTMVLFSVAWIGLRRVRRMAPGV